MKIIRENLFETNEHQLIVENMNQAKAILTKQNVPLNDPRFLELREMLGVATEPYMIAKYGDGEGQIKFKSQKGRMGYMGKFTKWIFKQGESFEKVKEVFNLLINHHTKIPNIDTFDTVEDLYDFLQGSEIDTKVNQIINQIPSRARTNANDRLKKLIELNIQYEKELKSFYSKKGGKFRNAEDLYIESKSLISNLQGGFNLQKIKQKINESGSEVEIILERPDFLVIKPLNYKASCALGSRSWCISTSESYWNSYADVFSNQYFIFDFTKDNSDKRSMIGVTVNPDGTHKAAHYRDDTVAHRDYLDKLFDDE